MHSSKQQVSLERFGFGKRDEVKNPIPLPLPVFGPQNKPVVKVKRKPGRPKLNIQAINDKLVQQRQKQLKAAESKAKREAARKSQSGKPQYVAVAIKVLKDPTQLPWGGTATATPTAAATAGPTDAAAPSQPLIQRPWLK